MALATAMCAIGCATRPVPDPRVAIEAFADAASRGDADAIYDMLDDEGRRSLSREDVRVLVKDQRGELAERATVLRSKDARVRATAVIRFADGEDVVLTVSEEGEFRVASADAMPAGARSPVQALDQLRRVLARRSYAGLLRVLSESTRRMLEGDVRSLVDGLENPEELDVQLSGETATVRIPGGRVIRLRREEGTWRIDDID